MAERGPAFPEIIVSKKLQLGKADGILREESGHSHFPGQVTVPACCPNAFEYVPFDPCANQTCPADGRHFLKRKDIKCCGQGHLLGKGRDHRAPASRTAIPQLVG